MFQFCQKLPEIYFANRFDSVKYNAETHYKRMGDPSTGTFISQMRYKDMQISQNATPIVWSKLPLLMSRFFLLLVGITALTGCTDKAPPKSIDSTDLFISTFWERPIASQGEPPAHLPAEETKLEPLACAQCHQIQYGDWYSSRHAQAMGPAVMGQLRDNGPHATGLNRACTKCHAPLKEQEDMLVFELSGIPLNATGRGKQIHQSGVICAGCHVRGYTWYGPPRLPGLPPIPEDSIIPHDGWQTQPEFEDSRFCICHQFSPNEFALNGKLIENTYEEWKASKFPENGITCQTCHMPGRRHLFRGIHDLDMTRNGVDIESIVDIVGPDSVEGRLVVRNNGVGHHFPTYVTARVYMNGFQQDANGKLVPGTFQQLIIARDIDLSMEEERFDTRIPAGDSAVLAYNVPWYPKSRAVIFRIWVEPDEYYIRFLEYKLDNNFTSSGRDELEQALADMKSSTYVLYEERHAIAPEF